MIFGGQNLCHVLIYRIVKCLLIVHSRNFMYVCINNFFFLVPLPQKRVISLSPSLIECKYNKHLKFPFGPPISVF